MKKSIQKGFTLIELMIVVAIIGILAAFAIPAYNDYIAKSQASEGLTLADGLKVKITEHLENGACEATGDNTDQGKYGTAVISGTYDATKTAPSDENGCQVTITYGNGTAGTNVSAKINGKTLVLKQLVNGSYTADGSSTLDAKYQPNAVKH